MNKILFVLVIVMSIYSCKKDSTTPTPDNSAQILRDYLKITGLKAQEVVFGSDTLYCVIERQGTGDSIGNRKYAAVYYKGYYPENDSIYFVATGGDPKDFKDSVYFDQSYGKTFKFALTSMIKGWQVGIPYFNEGAEGTIGQGAHGKLLIPSKLAYGDGKARIFDITISYFY